jgi:hypothetical protein
MEMRELDVILLRHNVVWKNFLKLEQMLLLLLKTADTNKIIPSTTFPNKKV